MTFIDFLLSKMDTPNKKLDKIVSSRVQLHFSGKDHFSSRMKSSNMSVLQIWQTKIKVNEWKAYFGYLDYFMRVHLYVRSGN